MFPFIFQLIYPKQCCACHEALISGEEFICLHCMNALPTYQFRQEKCNYFHQIFDGEIPVSKFFALAWFSEKGLMQQIMHQIKYKSNRPLAQFMGKLLAKAHLNSLLQQNFDAIIPIPLHPKRFKQRGYNQAEQIAIGISQVLGVEVITSSLIRVKYGESLVSQNRLNRFVQLENTFALENNFCEGKNILLFDDTLTTGATLISAGKVLKQGGAKSLSIGCLAVVR